MESLTNENWYSLEELSKMTGYHNTQKFYDEYILIRR